MQRENASIESEEPRTADARAGRLILAVAALSFASVAPPVPAAICALGGIAVAGWGLVGGKPRGRRVPPLTVAGIATVALILASLGTGLIRIPPVTAAEYALWLGPPTVVGLLLGVRSVRRRGLPSTMPTAAVLVASVLTAGVLVLLEHAGSPVGVDVYHAHRAAADALADGENPYTDAVRFPDGSPYASPGAVHEGYAYPPVVLIAYSGSTWALGDPRWVNLVAWGMVLGTVVLWTRPEPPQRLVLASVVLLAAAPAWRLMVFTGWTEPSTIALMLGAALVWRRHPVASGVLLGLGLASKQYMILLLPLLLVHRDEGRTRRTAVAVAVAGATLIPFAVLDMGAFLEALIFRQLSLGFRPDSQSLPGLLYEVGMSPEIPIVLGLAATLVVGWVLGRRSNTPGSFLATAGAVLGSFFLLTPAFANYWFLAGSLVALGLAFSGRSDEPAWVGR